MQHKILIVDDETNIRTAIKEFFTSRGFEVHCASEKKEACELLDAHCYEAVLLDLCLTGSDDRTGLELVDYVRDRSATTWILLLTAYGSEETKLEARKRGVDLFLNKPQRLSHIEMLLRGLLAQAA